MTLLPAFLASCVAALAVTPLAIRAARTIGLLDHPVGYKAHAEPTPYLGGGVLLTGFMVGALVYGAVDDSALTAIFVGAAVMWLVGTLDDRFLLGPRVRVLAEVAAGVLLWDAGLGWSLFPGDVLDLVVTVLWVVGIVNAFNLMDNIDGAAGTVGGVCAAGVALLAAQEGPEALSALAVALCGACVGFLCSNLTRPARIFLGDGGSMLLGFLVAALVMAAVAPGRDDRRRLLPGDHARRASDPRHDSGHRLAQPARGPGQQGPPGSHHASPPAEARLDLGTGRDAGRLSGCPVAHRRSS